MTTNLVTMTVFLGIAAVLAANASDHSTLVLATVGVLLVFPFMNASPVLWIGLAVTAPWVSRLLSVWGPVPRAIDFIDFPLVLAALGFAGLQYFRGERRLGEAELRICRWLLVAGVVMALSWGFSDPSEPQRLVAAWVLALQPFLLLIAILVTPMTSRQRATLLTLITLLLCGQVAFSLADVLAGETGDDIKGTLLEAGAGHHVSAGGLVLGFLVLACQRVPRLLIAGFGALGLVVIVAADAKQVLFVLPLSVFVFAVTTKGPRGHDSALTRIGAGVLMAGASIYALLSYSGSDTAFDFIDRSSKNETGKFAVADALWADVTSSAHSSAFGLGPGESVSRFAFLTTPKLLKDGSPADSLGLHVSKGAQHYDDIAFGGRFTGNSSFTSAQSSVLGVFGDYGIAGSAAFLGLVVAVIVALLRSPATSLRAAALGAWTMLLPLAVVFDWLEQPPFTLAVILITGLALRTGDDEDDGPKPASSEDKGYLGKRQLMKSGYSGTARS